MPLPPSPDPPPNHIMSALESVARAREQVDDARNRLDRTDSELRAAILALATALGVLGGVDVTGQIEEKFPSTPPPTRSR